MSGSSLIKEFASDRYAKAKDRSPAREYVIVFCGKLMALEGIFGGQVTSGHFRADEENI